MPTGIGSMSPQDIINNAFPNGGLDATSEPEPTDDLGVDDGVVDVTGEETSPLG